MYDLLSSFRGKFVLDVMVGNVGKAGFPSKGRPYGQFYFGRILGDGPKRLTKHLIMNVFGHCIRSGMPATTAGPSSVAGITQSRSKKNPMGRTTSHYSCDGGH